VISTREASLDALHDLRKLCSEAGHDDQMNMIGHDDVGRQEENELLTECEEVLGKQRGGRRIREDG